MEKVPRGRHGNDLRAIVRASGLTFECRSDLNVLEPRSASI